MRTRAPATVQRDLRFTTSAAEPARDVAGAIADRHVSGNEGRRPSAQPGCRQARVVLSRSPKVTQPRCPRARRAPVADGGRRSGRRRERGHRRCARHRAGDARLPGGRWGPRRAHRPAGTRHNAKPGAGGAGSGALPKGEPWQTPAAKGVADRCSSAGPVPDSGASAALPGSGHRDGHPLHDQALFGDPNRDDARPASGASPQRRTEWRTKRQPTKKMKLRARPRAAAQERRWPGNGGRKLS